MSAREHDESKVTLDVEAAYARKLAKNKAALDAAEALAGGCRSFMSSLPFQPPEAVGDQVRWKIAGPLAEYERAMGRGDV